MRSHPKRTVAVLVLVVAVVAGGLAVWLSRDTPGPSADVATGSFRDLGSGVSVSDGAPSSIRATPDGKVAKPSFTGIEPVNGVVHLTPDGDLPAPVTLRFALNRQVEGADVIVAVNRTGVAEGWELVAPTKVEDGFAYVTTDHLSWWDPLVRSFTNLVDAAKAELKKSFDTLTGDAFAEAEKPKCAGERDARTQGYSIGSKGSDPLYWCLGLEGGKPIVRIVDKRRYPVFVNHAGLTVAERPKERFLLEWVAQQSFSDQRTVLMPFDQAALSFPLGKGRSISFTTEYDGFAESLYQLEFGLTSLINILTRFGAGGGTISNGALKIGEYDRVVEKVAKALGVKECATAVDQRTPDVGAILKGCFSPAALADIFGWQGVLLGAVMVAGPAAEFFRSQFETLRDLLGGRDQETVTVGYNPRTSVPDPHVVRFDGIGPLNIGLTAKDLRGRGYTDQGNAYDQSAPSCVRYAKDGQALSLSVEARTGRVLAVRNFGGDQALRTQIGGIRVGSTLAELRKAFTGYSIDEQLDLDFGQGSNGVVVSSAQGAIGFGLEDGSPGDYAAGRAKVTYLAGVGSPGHAPTNREDGC
ncbi:hypothetical protein ACIA5G_42640 [Amycolatopsis sp. NPDC051758]|uniref:hypothetical protein n=1 Tax=Amycolatopsis sp. NPDC051758 TaxID=3363935 RepID=UPI003799D9D2